MRGTHVLEKESCHMCDYELDMCLIWSYLPMQLSVPTCSYEPNSPYALCVGRVEVEGWACLNSRFYGRDEVCLVM